MQLLTGWLVLLLSIVGHTELWVIAVNRLHALYIRPTRLRKFRTLHDLAVLGYPFALMWLTGVGENSLLRGGQLNDQPQPLQLLLVATAAGCLPLLCGIIRWQFIRNKQFLHRDDGERFNVENAARTDPSLTDIRGPRRHPSQLWPLNEIFLLETNP